MATVRRSPSTRGQGLAAPRILTWLWIAVVVGVGFQGLVGLYSDPGLVAIEEFSALYQTVGLSDRVMITVFLALPLGLAVGVGVMIVRRRGSDRGALALAAGLVALYFFVSGAAVGIEWTWVRNGVQTGAMFLVALLLVVFPTGTFIPRWSAVVPGLVLAASLTDPGLGVALRSLLGSEGMRQADPALAAKTWPWLLLVSLAFTAQVIRYRHHSTQKERHQTRWVATGVVFMLLPPTMLLAVGLGSTSRPEIVGIAIVVSALGSYVLPITLAIAVFRHHLYDIDKVISRTVSYGLVAGTVAGVYALPVVLFPALVRSDEDLFIAGATLVVAGIFNPLRRRIQRWTDARFNRSRFDAQREIEELGTRLRDEIRPAGVVDGMIDVIDRTLEPTGRAVWIRQVGGSGS